MNKTTDDIEAPQKKAGLLKRSTQFFGGFFKEGEKQQQTEGQAPVIVPQSQDEKPDVAETPKTEELKEELEHVADEQPISVPEESQEKIEPREEAPPAVQDLNEIQKEEEAEKEKEKEEIPPEEQQASKEEPSTSPKEEEAIATEATPSPPKEEEKETAATEATPPAVKDDVVQNTSNDDQQHPADEKEDVKETAAEAGDATDQNAAAAAIAESAEGNEGKAKKTVTFDDGQQGNTNGATDKKPGVECEDDLDCHSFFWIYKKYRFKLSDDGKLEYHPINAQHQKTTKTLTNKCKIKGKKNQARAPYKFIIKDKNVYLQLKTDSKDVMDRWMAEVEKLQKK